jgi:diguanylate cyclase (GGDEF)-like protein/PAS domain S-box-containing protein
MNRPAGLTAPGPPIPVYGLSPLALDQAGDISHDRDGAVAVAVEAAEHRFRCVIEHASDLLVVIDRMGEIRYGSPVSERLLGYPQGSQDGRQVFDFVHPDDADLVQRRFLEALTIPGVTPPVSFRARHADGSWRWLEAVGNNLLDDPVVGGIVLSLRDVSERRADQERLHRLGRLQAVLAEANEVMLRATDRDHVFAATTRAAVEAGGLLMAWIGVDDGGRIVPVASAGMAAGYLQELVVTTSPATAEGRGPTGRAWRSGRPEICHDIAADVSMATWHAAALGRGYRSSAAFPLTIGGTVVGVLSVYAGEVGFFTGDEVDLLSRLAASVTHAWETIRRAAEHRSAERARADADVRFRHGFDHSAVGAALIDLENRYVEVNPALCAMLGRTAQDLIGRRSDEVTHPDDRPLSAEFRRRAVEDGVESQSLEKRYRRPDGTEVWVAATRTLLRDDEGRARYFFLQAQDITARRQAEQELRTRLRQQAEVAELGHLALSGADPDAIFAAAVQAVSDGLDVEFAKLLEFDDGAGDLRLRAGVGWNDDLSDTYRVDAGADSQAGYTLAVGEPVIVYDLHTERRFAGPPLLLEHGVRSGLSVPVVSAGRPWGVLGAHTATLRPFADHDVHFLSTVAHLCAGVVARDQAQSELVHQAMHDQLTGLPNRLLLGDRLAQALRRLDRHPGGVAVLIADLDQFKIVNDTMGHPAGDRLLAEVAARLAGAVRPGDTLARHGGDEFVILCEDCPGPEVAEAVAARILGVLADPFELDGDEIFVTVSIGIAHTSAVGEPSSLLADADAAMYEAKKAGRARYAVYEEGTRDVLSGRRATEAGLRRALARGELRLHYQPKVDLRSGRIVGAEALLRWEHPERGLLGPADFMEVAEESGLIVPIGTWVLAESCRAAARLGSTRRRGVGLTMAANLSARQLADPDLPGIVRAALAGAGLDPASLCLEMTESLLIADTEATHRVLREFQTLGVRMHIDDFGTGYSSLAYLQRFPLDALKVDRSFVSGLGGTDPDSAAIAEAVIALAHSLRLAAVAEGVETPDQLAALRQLGCEQAQGYLFSKPVPEPEFARLLQARNRW